MLILLVNYLLLIVKITTCSINNENLPTNYNSITRFNNNTSTNTPVCINPCLIRKSIMNSISLGAPIMATLSKRSPRDPSFQKSDILEVMQPHELNGLLYSFQPSRKTLEFMSKYSAFLVIKLEIKEPIRSRLIIPESYIFQPKSSSDIKTTKKYVDSMLVYLINKPSSSNQETSNTIYVENQPIFTISSKPDPHCNEGTIVNISECDNAPENVKNIEFIYRKLTSPTRYLYLDICYKKDFCGCQYLIEECLIEDVLNKVDKINRRNDKCIIKGLNAATNVLINQKIRCAFTKQANSCRKNPICHCNNKCETQTNPIEKVCPTSPIEYIKYCWQATVNCFIVSNCAIKYPCDIVPSNCETNYTPNNNPGSPQCQQINTFQQLLSKIYTCKSIFEVRAFISLYLSTCSSLSTQLSSFIPGFDISGWLVLNDCRYDILRAQIEAGSQKPNVSMPTTMGKSMGKDEEIEKTIETEEKPEAEEDTEDVDEGDTDNESSNSSENNKPKSSNVWIWVTVSITAVLIVGVGSYFLFA